MGGVQALRKAEEVDCALSFFLCSRDDMVNKITKSTSLGHIPTGWKVKGQKTKQGKAVLESARWKGEVPLHTTQVLRTGKTVLW